MTSLCSLFVALAAVVANTQPAAEASVPTGQVVLEVRGEGADGDEAAAYLRHYLGRALLKRSGVVHVVSAEAHGCATDIEARRRLVEGQKTLIEGLEAYQELSLSRVLHTLPPVVDLYHRNLASADDLRPLNIALLFLGATYSLLKQQKQSRRHFLAAVQLRPAVDPRSLGFNPTMRGEIDRARIALGARPFGSLHLTSVPPRARVYVDGAFRGIAPVRVGGLAEGTHLVQMRRVGFCGWGQALDVQSATETPATGTLTATYDASGRVRARVATLLALAPPGEGAAEESEMRQVMSELQAQYLVVAKVRVRDERVEVGAARVSWAAPSAVRRVRVQFAYGTNHRTYAQEAGALARRLFDR